MILSLTSKGLKELLYSHPHPEIKRKLKQIKKLDGKRVKEEYDLTNEETVLIKQIKEQTDKLNINNLTRTEAYLNFYIRHPEIHWALLGHLVSRNGGWNMTDLKGELLSSLLSDKEKEYFFSFLERGNWLIFQDVYPQLLLYEESLNRNKSLFYLLPCFNVSIFMETIWNYFWQKKDHFILAIALVINEQSYLEQRVIQNPVYKETVLNTLEFKLQDILRLNHILFPFYENHEKNKRTVLIGQTLRHFNSLHERILLGKRLYSLLFSDRRRLEKIIYWAKSVPHTGSRKDYWPHLFKDLKQTVPGFLYKLRINNCQLRPGVPPIYSPRLKYAWKNVVQMDSESGDWFKDWNIIQYLSKQNNDVNGEIKGEYCETLEKIELAILAKKIIIR